MNYIKYLERGEDVFTARQVTILGLMLVFYIILYAIFLIHLVMSTSKETKLIQRYSGKKSAVGWKRILAAIAGGVIAVLLLIFYSRFV